MCNEINATYQGCDTYTKNDHHSYVKENFKFLADLIDEKLKSKQIPDNALVLDIGCATGALISYLSTRFPKFKFEGLDTSHELIGIAKVAVPGVSFRMASVHDLPEGREKKYDVILCMGVIGIFDEEEAKDALYRMIDSVTKSGLIYVFHQFNEFDIDVMIKHRRVDPDAKWDGWGTGWNIYSYRTIGEWLKDKISSHRFIEFNMPFPLEKDENPVRTWTTELADGKNQLTNGLKLMVDLRFLEISV